MARRGWGGSPPVDDHEAWRRIVEAAMRCVDRRGPDETTLSDVAIELSVTRQTVYRYFHSTDELFVAVAQEAVGAFIVELTAELRAWTDPADWVVEALATVIERLPGERYLTLLLATDHPGAFTKGLTSAAGIRMSRRLLDASPIDWSAEGFSDDEVDELVELMVRLFQSMVVDPSDAPRTGAALRRYFRRWVAPAVAPSPPGGQSSAG